MTEIIQNTLLEIHALLKKYGENDWAISILRLVQLFKEDEKNAARQVLNIYGGMGSFNDLVLYKDGQFFFDDNEKFYKLRDELHELCLRLV